jgi:hypothetical protein
MFPAAHNPFGPTHYKLPLDVPVAHVTAARSDLQRQLESFPYPLRGGAPFGEDINVLLWLSYIIMLSLYSQAFGSYAASLLPNSLQAVAKYLFSRPRSSSSLHGP